jgi:hypothetical protein
METRGAKQLDAHERRRLAAVAEATVARYPRGDRIWGLSRARIERVLRTAGVDLLAPESRRG